MEMVTMDIRKKRFMFVDYKLDGEERKFVMEVDPHNISNKPDFDEVIRELDKLEGKDYSDRIEIIQDTIIESTFVEDPKLKRRFKVTVPVRSYYTVEFDMDLSKYTHDKHMMQDVQDYGLAIARNNFETDRVDEDDIYNYEICEPLKYSEIDYEEIYEDEDI